MKPKRLISLLVAVCMMITMLPLSAVTAFAEDTSAPTGTASYGDYEYDYTINTEDGTATITKFRALVDGSYDITIPTDFGRFPVTAIGDDAFRGCSALKKVTIPQSVTSIGDSAFAGCHNLDSVTINDAATSIGNRAFTECPLTTTLSLGKKLRRSAMMPFIIALSWRVSPFHRASLPSAMMPLDNAMTCNLLPSRTLPHR